MCRPYQPSLDGQQIAVLRYLRLNKASTQLDTGRMGRLIAGHDWAATPLGAIEDWTIALRSNVELMLGQRHPICIFWGPDLNMLYNDAYAPILGAKEDNAIGQPAARIWSDVWENIRPFVDTALSGEGTWSENLPLVMTRNGYPEQTYWTFSYSPLYEDGKVMGMINVAVDATAGVAAREKEAALHSEMIHRVKNVLAMARAIASSTLRGASSLEEAHTMITNRIGALGRAQDALHGDIQEASVRQIIDVALSGHVDRPERADIDGPEMLLPAQQAIGLSLAVYELATNAVKYGALSNAEGRVSISWQAGEDGSFRFDWRERGGPPVLKPERQGFGSRLTNNVVAGYFSGKAATQFHESGIDYVLQGTLARTQR